MGEMRKGDPEGRILVKRSIVVLGAVVVIPDSGSATGAKWGEREKAESGCWHSQEGRGPS